MAAYSAGDKVQVKSKGETYTGIVSQESNSKNLLLRLDSGYSLGVKLGKGTNVKVLGKTQQKINSNIEVKQNSDLPKIAVISTGGTIASKVDYKTGAVSPISKPEELLALVPELTNIVNITKVSQPFTVFSEDMSSKEWQRLAKEVANELNKGNLGVIVTHGTDTLHYTAAVLSFMLRNLSKPVAVVGGQRSSDRGSFDGALNLICGAHFAKSDMAEVAVIMHGTTEDNFCLINKGTKVKKLHSSRRDAFRPINEIPLGRMWKDGTLEVLNKKYNKRSDKKVIADTKFEEKVALVKFYPGADPDILKYFVNKNYKGIIVEATGLGQVATNPEEKNKSWLPAIKEAIKKKVFIGFTSQTIYGRVDPYVYSSARKLHEAGVVFLEDMLSETALVKLGWVLGHTKNYDEVKKFMLLNIAGEINSKLEPRGFLY
ncbi:MAG: Glu-tRNA(Gln) amidotransferase subunit GatD [Nanoarchaeota archaeon]